MKEEFEKIWGSKKHKKPKLHIYDFCFLLKYLIFIFAYNMRYFTDSYNRYVNMAINIVLLIAAIFIVKEFYNWYYYCPTERKSYSKKKKYTEFFLDNFMPKIFDNFNYSILQNDMGFLRKECIVEDTVFHGSGMIGKNKVSILGETQYSHVSVIQSETVFNYRNGFVFEIKCENMITGKLNVDSKTWLDNSLKNNVRIKNKNLKKYFKIHTDGYYVPVEKLDGFYADDFINIIKKIYPLCDLFCPRIRITIESESIKLYMPGNMFLISTLFTKISAKRTFKKMIYIKELCEFLITRFN